MACHAIGSGGVAFRHATHSHVPQEANKHKLAVKLVQKARILLNGYKDRYKATAPKPPVELKPRPPFKAQASAVFFTSAVSSGSNRKRRPQQSWFARCCATCAPKGK